MRRLGSECVNIVEYELVVGVSLIFGWVGAVIYSADLLVQPSSGALGQRKVEVWVRVV